MNRSRLFTLARTLRRFGLVDNFGLSELVQRKTMPSSAAIARLVTESGNLLPPGTSAKFIAASIISDLKAAQHGNADLSKLSELVATLPKIPKGQQAAVKYQKTMLSIFRLWFEHRLGAMKLEETMFSGTKRVDIWAKNDQAAGFFVDLRTRFGLHCPRIFFECKNYTDDPKNPEFDQLLGRLNKTSTEVGFILCREIKDVDRVRQRCKEAYLRDKKLMLWLTDADVIELVQVRIRDGAAAMDALLEQRLDEVTLK